MVVDSVVDKRVPQTGAAVDFAGSRGIAVGAGVASALDAAVDAMSAAVGDPAEFLDVDVDQISGRLAFIPANLAPAGTYGRPGCWIGP